MARPEVATQVWRLFVDHVTSWITADFEARGIESILLKGPTFARLFYDHDWERPYTDTDLLIQDRDREQAEHALREHGFVRVDRDEGWIGPAPKYAHTFSRKSDGARVDLHWRLSGAAVSPEQVWSILRDHTAPIELAGRRIAALDAAASAFLAAIHNAHHGTRRPQTLADLDRAVERLGLAVWREAVCVAGQLRAAEPFAAGLRLTEAGDALADRLGLDRPASVEMWLKTNPSTNGARVLDRFAQTTTLSGRLRICLQVAVPPPVMMYTFFPLARRGRLGLALAYMLRPARLVAHAGPALRDLFRAQRDLRARAPNGQ